MVLRNAISLKVQLGIAAAILGAGTLLTAGILYVGMREVADRLDAALASDTRMARYASLSSQVSTFLVVATEAVQTGRPTEIRQERIAPVTRQIDRTFELLRSDVIDAVASAQALGLDAQSRYGTQSLGLARMEAMLESTLRGLESDIEDPEQLRAFIDTFASGFDPLLSQAASTETLFRNEALRGIENLRQTLSLTAVVLAVLAILVVAAFYFGLIQPQFRRLDSLREAALRIGQEDFAVALPTTRNDEIGQLYTETNRMAAALSSRQQAVQAEWERLNDTIAQRTKELRQANVQLEEVDENRRRFFADISHELRTPLTVILMEAQLGRQTGTDPEVAFATIESRAARLNRRIDDLLRVARSDSGQLALDPHPVALAELIADVTVEVEAEVATAGMTLCIQDIPDQNLLCDQNWTRQVIVGLIRNAIRHARDGKKVQLGIIAKDDTATITVTDNGPGVVTADQGRVFDRFQQGGSGNEQGFGMGLALARWVVEAQAGTISLTSPVPAAQALGPGPGTMIAVRFPVAPA